MKVMIRVVLGIVFRTILVTSTPSVNLMNARIVAETQVQNRVSGHKTRIERDENVVPKQNGVFIKKGDEAANQLLEVEEKLGQLVVHVHYDVKWGNACTELRGMYTQCLSHQVDIVCGDGNQSWHFRSKHTQV